MAGLLASVLISTLIGLITLRTTGASFLVITLMFSQAFHLATLYFNKFTMGDQGFILSGRLRPLRLGTAELAFSDPVFKYNMALVLFAIFLMMSVWLIGSPIGRILVGVRENEERTRLLGYNTFNYKLLSLIISGSLSGVAGSVVCPDVFIRGVILRLDQGEIRAIIGPNGAGKTTLVCMISGRISPTSGQVHFKDRDITRLRAWDRVALAIFSAESEVPSQTLRAGMQPISKR